MPIFVLKILDMKPGAIRNIREEVKQYIDHADARTVKMIHAMLEVASDEDWWSSMPLDVAERVEMSINEADRGEFVPHEVVKEKFKGWFMK